MADNDEPLGIIELDQNLADVEKPPELPAGMYTAEVQDVATDTSQKGNPYFKITFKVPPSEIPADLADDFEDGATLFYNRLVVPKKGDRRALFNVRKFYEALGLDSNVTSIDPNAWMGQTARLKVKMGSWLGDPRAEIASIESAEAPANKAAAATADKGTAAAKTKAVPRRR